MQEKSWPEYQLSNVESYVKLWASRKKNVIVNEKVE